MYYATTILMSYSYHSIQRRTKFENGSDQLFSWNTKKIKQQRKKHMPNIQLYYIWVKPYKSAQCEHTAIVKLKAGIRKELSLIFAWRKW